MAFTDMPDKFESLKDDPFRSLAAAVLEAGGFSKADEPFLEFLWANHFRDHLSATVIAKHPRKALAEAMKVTRSKASSHLPGWPGKP